MKTKFSRFAISLAVAGAFALVATTFTGCSIFKKLQAAKVLIQTKMEYKDLTFDNVDVYDDVMELVNNGMDGFLPNERWSRDLQNSSKMSRVRTSTLLRGRLMLSLMAAICSRIRYSLSQG